MKGNLLVALLLMPINWFIETVKWKSLVDQFQKLSFYKGLQSIFFGVLLSLVTPNRIGELGGRLVYIEKENRLNVFYTNLICSVSQLMITFLAGLIALNFLHSGLTEYFNFNEYWLLGLTLVLVFILFYIYFTSHYLLRLLSFFSAKLKIKGVQLKMKLKGVSRLRLMVMSLLRYIVFCFQFFLLLRIVEPDLSILEAFMAIMLIFFVTAIIPTTWILDLPVRTSIAFIVFENLGYSGLSGLLSSIVLWIINLLVPAFLGLFVIPKVDWLSLKKISL